MCKSSGSSAAADTISAGDEAKIVCIRDQNSETTIYTLLYNKFQDNGMYMSLLIAVAILVALVYYRAKICSWCPKLNCSGETQGQQHCVGYHCNSPMQPLRPVIHDSVYLQHDFPAYPFSHLMNQMPPRPYNCPGMASNKDDRYFY